MQIIFIISLLLLLLIDLYFFCLAPGHRENIDFPYKDTYIAHRGLFDNHTNHPENTLPAFQSAVHHGYGIELDVQRTKDGKLVVFHDASLLRMCGVDKKVFDCTYTELLNYPLADSTETIPLFQEVLTLVHGQVPLIVEIKSEGDFRKTTKATLAMLQSYTGVFCIESFHPLVLNIVKNNCPELLRGQLSTDFFKDKPEWSWHQKFFLSNLLLNFLSRPDFIAYNHKWKNQFSYRMLRTVFGGVHAAWTIKNQEELEEAKKVFDCIIFDSFLPKKH